MNSMKIVIIGGSGSFGKIFARLFKDDGHEVIITGRDRSKGQKVAEQLGVEFINENVEAAKKGDVVIISVYIENTIDVIKQVAPHVQPGCLLMDVTSVKMGPCVSMAEYASDKVEIMGAHPMFGPRVSSIEGLRFILTPIRIKKWEKFLFGFLERHKDKVFITTPEEHDKMMGVVQGLTHFAYISIASTLQELGADIKKTRRFSSPLYELMLDFIARIVGQSPQLYASIQTHNPFISEVHDIFIKRTKEIRDVIANNDIEAFTKIMTTSARHIGDLEESMGRSDKAILALTSELKTLMNSVGKKVCLRHIYSGVIHVGIVKDVTPDKVVLDIPNGEYIKLKLSNIELLTAESLKQWTLENIQKLRRDFSFIFPKNLKESAICSYVNALDPRIISCKIVDTYEGKQIPTGKKSITLRVETTDFTKDDFKLVEKSLTDLGGVIR